MAMEIDLVRWYICYRYSEIHFVSSSQPAILHIRLSLCIRSFSSPVAIYATSDSIRCAHKQAEVYAYTQLHQTHALSDKLPSLQTTIASTHTQQSRNVVQSHPLSLTCATPTPRSRRYTSRARMHLPHAALFPCQFQFQ